MITTSRTISRGLNVSALACGFFLAATTIILAQDHSKASMGMDGKVLLKTTKTLSDQPLVLPQTDKPEITLSLVDVQSDGHSSLHLHPVPILVYVMEGTVEIRAGEKSWTVKAGEASVEPMNTMFQMFNVGGAPAKLLVVAIGEEGKPTFINAE